MKNFTSLVSLMTFLNENGGSLLGHGSLSLRGLKEDEQKTRETEGMPCTFRLQYCIYVLNFFQYVHVTFFLLLGGSHVSLGLNHFVHKLSKPNGVVL